LLIYLLGSFFDTEDEGSVFLLKVSKVPPDHMVFNPRRFWSYSGKLLFSRKCIYTIM
jgi:hypothetical protein